MIDEWIQEWATAVAADYENLGGLLNKNGKFQGHITTFSKLLLQAAMLNGDQARAAFQAWQSVTDIDKLPFDQYQLMPVLYQNLVRECIDHPWLGRLRGIYRKTWYQHQTGYGAALKLGAAFADMGCQPIVFNGGAPAEQPAIWQPRSVISLVVPRNYAYSALKTAALMGYKPLQASTLVDMDDFFTWRSSILLQADQGTTLRLCWHFLDDWPSDDVDEWIVSRAVSSTPARQKLLSLDPTASLFVICASGASSLTKLVDVGQIMRQQDNIDWPWLESASKKAGTANPVPEVVSALRDILEDCIPNSMLHGFCRSFTFDSAENTGWNGAVAIKQHREKFRQLAAAQKIKPTLSAFCGYLKHAWETDSIWGIIRHCAVRTTASLSRYIPW